MKNARNKILTTCVFCIALMATTILAAQDADIQKQNQQMAEKQEQLELQKLNLEKQQAHMEEQKMHMQKQKEKIEAQRVAFITEKLQLTPAEAQVFWPVYNEYDNKRHELNKGFRNHKGSEKEIDALTDKEALELADQQLVEAQKMLDLRKEYHNKFKSVLPAKKLLKLYESEREFQKHLIDRIKGDKAEMKGKPNKPANRNQPGK